MVSVSWTRITKSTNITKTTWNPLWCLIASSSTVRGSRPTSRKWTMTTSNRDTTLRRRAPSREAKTHSTKRATYTAIITLENSTYPQKGLYLHPNNHSSLLHKISNNIHQGHSNIWESEAQIKLISHSFNRETYLLKNRLKVQQIQWLNKQTVLWLNLSDLLSTPKAEDLQGQLAHSFLNQWNISKSVGAKLESVHLCPCNNQRLITI